MFFSSKLDSRSMMDVQKKKKTCMWKDCQQVFSGTSSSHCEEQQKMGT